MTLFCRTTVLTGESGKNPRCTFTRRRGRVWWLENQLHVKQRKRLAHYSRHRQQQHSKFQASAGRHQATTVAQSRSKRGSSRSQPAQTESPRKHNRAGPLFIQSQTRQQSLPQILKLKNLLFLK